jgi:chromosome segregation ATPase
MMWAMIAGWFYSIFNFFRSTLSADRTNFQAVITTQNEVIAHQGTVIKSMESRIATMDTEFRKAMERRDTEIFRLFERVDSLEKSEERCREALQEAQGKIRAIEENAARILRDEQEKNKALRRKLNEAKRMLGQANEVRKKREDPAFQHDTMRQTEVLMDEVKETKLDTKPRSE